MTYYTVKRTSKTLKLQLLKVKDLLLFSIFYDNKLNSICQIQLEAHPLTVMGKFHYFMSLFYYY